jgi:hypothetical protein
MVARSARIVELAASLDADLASSAAVAQPTRLRLGLGDEISAVLQALHRLQRQLARLVQLQRLDGVASEDVLTREQESEGFRRRFNALRIRLRALSAGDDAPFRECRDTWLRLLQDVITFRDRSCPR